MKNSEYIRLATHGISNQPEDFWADVVKQIKRDFGFYNQKVLTDLGELTPEILIRNLSIDVQQMLIHDRDKLRQVFYRMDLSENQMVSILSNYSDEVWADQISTMMVIREMKKVNSRNDFKTNGL